ncbi:MAG: orotidine-5'-phosphate decarboxylase [Methanomassiliicoccales archaeon]|nr:orotidine-5'-phosphate decarboxylase [Methanomassiliicoccales archaeon]
MRSRTRLILALDEIREDKAISVVERVRDYADAIKINWPLVLSTSPGIITRISKLSDVICDFKVADIPNTNRLIVQQAVALGASGVIVHGFTGRDSVKAAVEAARGAEVFVVTEMSHPGGEEFIAPVAERLAELAVECGASGVIAPATRPERIRAIRGIVGRLKILSPGVGAQGGIAADAIANGADSVIVGRSIYNAQDPRDAARGICEQVAAVLDAAKKGRT